MSDTIWDIRQRVDREYERENAGLVKLITTVAGHALVEELGEEQTATGDIDHLHDGIYVALFDGGVGIMVEYSSMEVGSEYTPGSPARVEYYALRKKAPR